MRCHYCGQQIPENEPMIHPEPTFLDALVVSGVLLMGVAGGVLLTLWWQAIVG